MVGFTRVFTLRSQRDFFSTVFKSGFECMQEVCLGTEATDVSTVLERNSYTYVFTYFCMYVELNSAMRLKERHALGGSVVCIYIHIY